MDVILFLVLIISILFIIKPKKFKLSYSQISEKNMIKLPLISLIHLTLQANFGITLGMMKSNGCVALLDEIKWMCGFTKCILLYILNLM